MTTLDYFDAYVAAGFKVIPLYQNSKVPVGTNWNQRWDRDLARQSIEQNPKSNLGILLGTIVDVEGDTPEANRLVFRLTDECPHPMYRSSKSIHHFFLNPDPNLTVATFNGIEFRAYKHQSVLPPSQHGDGTSYAWLSGTKFPVPPMPELLRQYYFKNRGGRNGHVLKPGHVQVWCSECERKIFLHGKRYALEKIAFYDLGLGWLCHKCRTVDVREACRSIRKVMETDRYGHGVQRMVLGTGLAGVPTFRHGSGEFLSPPPSNEGGGTGAGGRQIDT